MLTKTFFFIQNEKEQQLYVANIFLTTKNIDITKIANNHLYLCTFNAKQLNSKIDF